MSQHTYNKHGWKSSSSSSIIARLWGWFRKTPIGKNLLLLIVFFCVLGSLMILGLMAYASKDLPSPGSLTERKISQTTKIYDRTGEHLLYEIAGTQNRTLKKLQQGYCDKMDPKLSFGADGIPLFAAEATIAAEDRNFCTHSGFDVKGLARAFALNLIGKRVGGSTLTQQLVKNAILSNEKTFTRKIKELILSIELEQKYSKDEILQIYLNEIPYGSSYYGIEAASQNFFHKTVKDLSVAEAATLAALPKATTTYLNNPDLLLARRDYILDEMQKLNFIDKKTWEEAKKEKTPVNAHISNITAPHFVLDVKANLEDKYGRREVEEGGMKVITTLDYKLQQIAEEEVIKGVEAKGPQYGFNNASFVAEDPKTGQILAMVGSKDYFDKSIDGQVNVSTRLRQPGSSFKPIVYTKAFEMGYTPNTVLWDVVTDFSSDVGVYTPHDYDLKERGPLRIRNALQMSLNIPAVKTVYLVGVENALDFATSLGYTSFSNHANFGLSIVLGGGEVRLVEHVNAYATFANDGKRNEQVSVLRVEDSDGNVLEEWKQKDPKQVVDSNATRMISNVLSDNGARTVVFGPTSSLQLGDRPVAAKSGTTNNFHDAWTMGYTPSLVAGVWVGNNNNVAMKNKADGSIVAGPIWNAFMKRALEGTPIEPFIAPDIHPTGKLVLDGTLPLQSFVIDRASGKLATEFTPDSFKETRVYGGYHEILQYVTPSDPLGAAPEHPEQDPQYAAWEKGITDWMTKRQKETGVVLSQAAPPTEQDDLHISANTPTIQIISPSNNSSVEGRIINVDVSANAPRGISRVEYYLEGSFIGSSSRSPYNLTTQIPSAIEKGVHTLKAVAYDDIDSSGSETVSIQILTDAFGDSIELIDPKNGQTIEKTSDVYTIVTSLKNPQNYSSLSVYADKLGSGINTLVGQIINPSSPFVTVDWKLPENGSWVLSASAHSKDGQTTILTAGIIVQIKASSGGFIQPSTPPAADGTSSPAPIFNPQNSLDPFAK